MRFHPAIAISILGLGSWVAVCAAQAVTADAKAAGAKPVGKATFKGDIQPLVNKYCIGCHSEKAQTGGITLFAKEEADLVKHRELWERASRSIGAAHMPPKNMPQPTKAERELLVEWIDAKISQADCNLNNPGRVTMRRLNRAEYNNTVRDLLGVDFRPADDFPSDDVGYGFDNIGDVLSISPLLMEKYLEAAEDIVQKALVLDGPEPVHRFQAENPQQTSGTGTVVRGVRLLIPGGHATAQFDFPKAGEYRIRARGYLAQANDEPVQLTFRVDEKDVQTVEVPGNTTKPQVYETRVKVEPGKRPVAAVFVSESYDPTAMGPEGRRRNRRNLNLAIDYVEVVGPVGVPREYPESHKRVFIAQPGANTLEAKKDAARKIIGAFLPRVYRRPVTSAEIDRLVQYTELAHKEGDSFEQGIALAVQAALVSPNFLFRVELDRQVPQPKDGTVAAYPLNDYELASRLSYFLWSTMPDDELFALAEKGELKKPDVLAAQAKRMLHDPKAKALVDNFAMQWLTLKNLKNMSADPKRFPTFNEQLKADMQRETELFFTAVMKEDRSILDFLDGRFTYLNERLAKHYGIDWVKGDHFRKVVFTGDLAQQRAGILTQASILTITSNPTRTSPVKRGKWILEQVLGTPPPPAPPNVPPLEEEGEGKMLTGTLRERMEQHRKDPGCASCHTRMDALGFGFENFDAVGAWRTNDGSDPIDASGELPGGEKFRGPVELVRILKGQKDQVTKNLTEAMMTFALGRGMEYYDRCHLDDIRGNVGKRGYRFSALVTEIVKSEPFRMRRGEGDQQQ